MNYRHGDLALIGIKNLPKGLKESKSNVLMTKGSGGHPHTFSNGKLYISTVGEFVFGFLKAKNTSLHHAEHGEGKNKVAKIKDGIYELRRQFEETNEGMKEVID